MENIEEKQPTGELKMIGARVPIELAERFASYCKAREHRFFQTVLFESLAKWWLGLDESIQQHIYRGRVSAAHEQIAREVAAQQADAIVSESEADSLKQKRSKGRGRSSKTG